MELELRGITKRFGPLVANDGISLSVAPGQVHALLGENGAGKTTLMNVLFGLTRPDQGEIHIDGKAASFRSPKDAIAAGIGMVHQHFMLVPVFTVAENVTLGIEQAGPAGLLDRRKTRAEVRELSHRYGLDVDPDALIEDLPVGIQQRVEIVKALVRQAIASGRALEVFRRMIKAQGGDPDADLPRAAHQVGALPAAASGWVTRLDARAVGVAAWRLGAGRARKEDSVSHTAGVRCLAKPGDRVTAGQPVLELHTDDPARFAAALEAVEGAVTIGSEPPARVALIVDQVGV